MAKEKSKNFDELLSILEKRFLENENRHLGIKWSEILQKLEKNQDLIFRNN